MTVKKAIHVSGKRKLAVARASLREGKGVVRINSLKLSAYQPEIARMMIEEPLLIAGDVYKTVNIDVNVFGGGWHSQAEAARLVVAKALVGFVGTKKIKQDMLEYDRHLVVADKRRNEPHKPNDSKPRASRQKSYR
ncbi:MAG TPA: 30S ribosomal protein S9 [Candidatus Nanoarchaeia archaeon]|nr:30S ribosomal protein S9 [Candidatus Nanoarchaeia archaeon]